MKAAQNVYPHSARLFVIKKEKRLYVSKIVYLINKIKKNVN